MCGRMTQNVKLKALVAKYGVRPEPELDLTPRYNGCPGQHFAAVRRRGGNLELARLRWGLIPAWATNREPGTGIINAR